MSYIMKEFYSARDIESFVQRKWNENKTFKVTENTKKEKFYCLSMLPYPSGKLHMGHVRNYTIGDVIARFNRLLGKNVLHPIGWDAFGLPAENAAIKNNVDPELWTYSNIRYMRKQLKSLGFSYDWSREIITCNPNYYKWEQWFFIYLYKKGLAYKKKALVNWCPQDQTVLANEQVIDGCCWRCNTKVEDKEILQWFLKITEYAEELLSGLNNLNYWPDQVKIMQRNWIGRSEKMELNFKIINSDKIIPISFKNLEILTKATYVSISINHPLIIKISKRYSIITDFINKCNEKKNKNYETSKLENNGIFSKIKVINPINQEILPVWIKNNLNENKEGYVELSVPSLNKKDLKFAIKYKLPIHPYSENFKKNLLDNKEKKNDEFSNFRKSNLDSKNVKYSILLNKLIKKGIVKKVVNYKIRDWIISRQRYWGAPIPMLTLENGNIIPVPLGNLPVILPKNVNKKKLSNLLKEDEEWIKTYYKEEIAYRETDTFDTFVESSWYYLRYTNPNINYKMIDPIAAKYWLPIDQYIGGIEHATLHLMYFRFYHKLIRDAGFIDTDEPVKRLLCQGMVLADTFYYINNNGKRIWISSSEIEVKRDKLNRIIEIKDKKGRKIFYDGMKKMSKSKNNGIDPKKIIDKYGADTLRLFIMFAAPVEMDLEWKESGIKGSYRFLKRIWTFVYKNLRNKILENFSVSSLNLRRRKLYYTLHKTILKVTDDISRRQTFNTAISEIMKLMKNVENFKIYEIQDLALVKNVIKNIIKMLYPFTPHFCFFLWKVLGEKQYIDDIKWPKGNINLLKKDQEKIIIQVNGKFRGSIVVKKNLDKEKMYKYAAKSILLSKYLDKFKVSKIIFLKNKLINFVLENKIN